MTTMNENAPGLMPREQVRPVKHAFRTALGTSMAAYVQSADQCDEDYAVIAQALWDLFTPTEREALAQLVTQGPVWDGDVISKTTRDRLLTLGLASRACNKGEQGYTVANYRGYDVWRRE